MLGSSGKPPGRYGIKPLWTDPEYHPFELTPQKQLGYDGIDKWLRHRALVLKVSGLNPAMTWLKMTSLLSLSYRRQHNVCSRNALGALPTNTFNIFKKQLGLQCV